jgi:hypothetical protein
MLQRSDLPDVADDICQLFNWPSLPPIAMATLVEWQEEGVSRKAVTLALGEMKELLAARRMWTTHGYEKFEAIIQGVNHWTAYLRQTQVGGRL